MKNEQVVLGRITTVYGVKGWLKVHSATDPVQNILDYKTWTLKQNGRLRTVEIDQGRKHGKGIVIHIKGCDDRDIAREYCASDVLVDSSLLPTLDTGEYYWSQLEGLRVLASHESEDGVAVTDQLLGKVDHLIETGSNDVLVIKADSEGGEKRERLVPYLDHVVTEINLQEGFIRVDWDPEF